MPGMPQNLTLCEEPDYEVWITYPDGKRSLLASGDRKTWKRLSAVHHARQFAMRNPTLMVSVQLVE